MMVHQPAKGSLEVRVVESAQPPTENKKQFLFPSLLMGNS
jgi:hypothetical protein